MFFNSLRNKKRRHHALLRSEVEGKKNQVELLFLGKKNVRSTRNGFYRERKHI